MKSYYVGRFALCNFLTLLSLCATTSARGELVAAWGDNKYGQTQLPEGLNQVVAVAGGLGHNLALKSNRKVVEWGNYPDSLLNTPPTNLPFVTAIAAGANHSLALTSEGAVIAWGENDYLQTEVPPGLSNVVAIAGGYYNSAALQSDGNVTVWGEDPYGATNIPPGLSGVVAIACGESHILALTANGNVVAWGRNLEGETNVPADLSNVVAIGAGATFSFAITADGTVVGWGDNSAGQLDIPPGLTDVVAVTGGEYQSLALQADGTVVAWGVGGDSDNFGQGVVPASLSNVTAIAAGYTCNLALTFQGPIQITQDPQSQTIPTGSVAIFSVAATGAQPVSYQWFLNGQPLFDDGGIGGSATATLSITNFQPGDEGTYDVLVSNALGSVLSAEAFVNLIPPPEIVVQPTNQSALFFGSAIFSVQAQSTLPVSYQWLFNGEPIPNETNADLILSPLTSAQDGYYNAIVSSAAGTTSSDKAQLTVYQAVVSTGVTSAVQSFFLQFTNVTAVAGGSGTIYALKSDGTVAGYVPYNGPDYEVPYGLSDVVQISGSYGLQLALRSNGTVAAWGSGPTNITVGLTNVIAVAAGGEYGYALQSNGTVVEWGENPPSGASKLSNVVAISAESQELFALTANGSVFECEAEGQPTLVPGVSNVIAFAQPAGSGGTFGLKVDGTLLGWNGVTPPKVSNVVEFTGDYSSQIVALESNGTLAPPSPSFPLALSNVFAIANIIYGEVALINDGSPVITVQPGNQFTTNGGTIWLHVRAVGVQPMSIQWQLNGTNIPNATNTDLTITNAQQDGTFLYSAVASNTVAAVASRIASVTVSQSLAPPITETLGQALDATNLTWSTFGNALWFVEGTNTHDGIAAAQSGAISNSMSSSLETIITGPGTLTFWWRVSSEQDFDFLTFYIGSGNNDYTAAASISGEVPWEEETFPIGSGTHWLKWVYAKDPTLSVGEDSGWLDQVSFVPTVMPAKLGAPTLLPNGNLVFQLYSTNGSSLSLSSPSDVLFEASSNLVDWIPLTNAVTITNGAAELSDPGATNSTTRFYRIVGQ